jgi:hypothetical protein
MERLLEWLWPELLSPEEAERVLRGAARVWFVLALIMLVIAAAPAVLATMAADKEWPTVVAYAFALLVEFAALVLVCRLLETRRSRLLALGLLMGFAVGAIGALGEDGFDLLGVALFVGIGLVTVNALRAANAWHSHMRSRIRWGHLALAAAVFGSLSLAALAVDAETVLGWDYPEPSGRSVASMLLENAAIFAAAAVTRWMPVVSFAAGGPAGAAMPTEGRHDAA